MPMPDFFFFNVSQGVSVAGASANVPLNASVATGSLGSIHDVTACVQLGGGTAPRPTLTYDFSSGGYTSGWISFLIDGAATIAATGLEFVTISGPTSDLFRFATNGTTGSWDVQYWNGAAWTTIGSTLASPSLTGTVFRIDIRFILDNAAGEFSVYINGSLVRQLLSTDTIFTADTTLTKIKFTGITTATNTYLSVWMLVIDNVDTRTLLITEDLTLANGGATGFTNFETEIDEVINVANDVDVIVANAADLYETYTWNGIYNLYLGNTVEAVVLAVRARAQTDPGLYLRGVIRSGGVNYDVAGTPIQPLAGTFNNYLLVMETNPTTGVAFTTAQIDAYEWGLGSKSTP
jgi:hypothetical protein